MVLGPGQAKIPHAGRHVIVLATLLCGLCAPPRTHAESSALIIVPDSVCLPGEQVFIKAQLFHEGLLGMLHPYIQGELLEFLDADGKLLTSQITDPTGLARIPYAAARPGNYHVNVRLAENPRYRADPVAGRIFVRRQVRPLFFVSLEGGLQEEVPLHGLFRRTSEQALPLPDCVEMTGRIAACSDIVYLSDQPLTQFPGIREWLEGHKFPEGPVLFLKPSRDDASRKKINDSHPFKSIRKNASPPAYLVTGDPHLAEIAADNDIDVCLLKGDKRTVTSKKAEGKGRSIKTIQGWKEIASPCKAGPSP